MESNPDYFGHSDDVACVICAVYLGRSDDVDCVICAGHSTTPPAPAVRRTRCGRPCS